MDAIPVIVNAHSGPDGKQADAGALAESFAAQGLAVKIVQAEGEAMERELRTLLAGAPPLLVVGGGDGTLGSAASQLAGSDTTLGILPLGTLNHFARDLGIPPDTNDAIAVIAAGHAVRVDVGTVDGRVFLNNSSLGLYPTIVNERDRERRRLRLGKWPALARATWLALRHPATFSANVCLPGEDLQRRTPFVFIGNNRYVLEGFGIGKREKLDDGVLSICILRPKGAFGFLWLGLRALFGRASQEDFEALEATELRVESDARGIEVAADGEVWRSASPVRFGVRPRALKVLVPAGGAGGSG